MPQSPVEQYVERMGGAMTDAGLPRLPSRVFAALTADDDGRMTSAELSGALGISPAAVSGAIKFLTQVGFVHRERERGTRRDVYVVDDDAWHGAMVQKDSAYAPMLKALDDGLAGLPDDSPARPRLVLMREFLAFVSSEMDGIAARWEVRRRELEDDLRTRG
ncbi:winged helix-turn-helix transcriptional regulator [Nocardioides sp. J2M5]|uniref:GbsR/MarR family transcriptional regulator n=1 Tax=Nocardioides palaemonis TaxID=2829810 RepID=UPI001BA65DB7|nr:MarR family transcriptional regulator [Nocardioides palaemonis]MBS2937804.1 winged helix-turn-helix transcriptional regulator [Nocardioides palaemonis]